MRAFVIAAASTMMLTSLVVIAAPVSAAPPLPTALILGDSVSPYSATDGSAMSLEEQQATLDGFAVTVVTGAIWDAMSAADFASYQVLIIGDPTCQGTDAFVAANSNAAVWEPVVMSSGGNKVLIGTDPTYHHYANVGATKLEAAGIAYAGELPGATGLYLDLTCGYHGVPAHTPIPIMDGLSALGPHQFTALGVPCEGSISIIALTGPTSTLHDSDLANWECSVHESFDTFPADWIPLAISTDAPPPHLVTGTDADTGAQVSGDPYIMISGLSDFGAAYTLRVMAPGHDTGGLAEAHAVSGNNAETDGVSVQNPNAGSAGVIRNVVNTSVPTTTATAQASSELANVNLLGGLVTASAVHAFAEASFTQSPKSATTSTSGSGFVNLVVNAQAISDSVPPNTVIAIPGQGTLTLDEQVATGTTRSASMAVTMIHFVSTDGTIDISVGFAYATAGVNIAAFSTGNFTLPVLPTPPAGGVPSTPDGANGVLAGTCPSACYQPLPGDSIFESTPAGNLYRDRYGYSSSGNGYGYGYESSYTSVYGPISAAESDSLYHYNSTYDYGSYHSTYVTDTKTATAYSALGTVGVSRSYYESGTSGGGWTSSYGTDNTAVTKNLDALGAGSAYGGTSLARDHSSYSSGNTTYFDVSSTTVSANEWIATPAGYVPLFAYASTNSDHMGGTSLITVYEFDGTTPGVSQNGTIPVALP